MVEIGKGVAELWEQKVGKERKQEIEQPTEISLS
jgi:hypothetical protein